MDGDYKDRDHCRVMTGQEAGGGGGGGWHQSCSTPSSFCSQKHATFARRFVPYMSSCQDLLNEYEARPFRSGLKML